MNWFSANRGYIVCAVLGIFVGALGVLWLKSSKSQIVTSSPVVDNRPRVQPVFVHDTVILKSLAIDTLARRQPLPALSKTETLRVVQEKPMPAFTLHLSSSDSVPKTFGLDSVSVSYQYPSGRHFFAYWGVPNKPLKNVFPARSPLLLAGFAISYLRYQNNLEGFVYGRVRISGLNLESGFHHQSNQQFGWYVGLRREWILF